MLHVQHLKYTAAVLATLAMVAAPTAVNADDEDFVKTETGAPLKVVVNQDGAIYESAEAEGSSRPVSMFQFFYVLKPEAGSKDKTKNDFYRVSGGESKKLEIGWIHKDIVVEWSHRQALGLRPVKGRERALFYKDKEDLSAAYSDGDAPEPLSREPKGGTLDINLVPILDRFTMEADGDEVAGYRVAYLHSRSGKRKTASAGAAGGTPAGPNPDAAAVDLSKMTLDIVFVVDTTASMQPHIDNAKAAVSKIAKSIAGGTGGAAVRFGLVAYRDVVSAGSDDWYVTKLLCDLEKGANHDDFQKILGAVEDADRSSEDIPEDVFAGMKMAVQQAKWNPNAFKHIILLGDAPAQTASSGAKNSEKLTIAGVNALAQPRGQENVLEKITVHAIHCYQSAKDGTAVEQFKQLAQGEEYPGKYYEFNTSGSAEFVDELSGLVLSAMKGAGIAKGLTGGAAELESKVSKDTPGLGLLMEMVNASEATGEDAPNFSSGFCCEIDGAGNQVFEPYVLVQHGRLQMFRSFLDFSVSALRTSGDAGSRDVKKVLQSVQVFATQLSLGEPIKPDEPLSKIASMILGFPVRSNIFSMTFTKLAAMSEADFNSWVQEIEASKTIIKTHVENSRIWRSLGREVELEQRYCFLKVTDLP